MAGEPWTPRDEALQREALRRRAMERKWEEMRKITWTDVMSLREKMMYGLVLATCCAFAVMVVLLVAVVR